MKRLIRDMLDRLGFEVKRKTDSNFRVYKPDETVYDIYPRQSLSGRHFYNIGAGLFEHPYWTNVDYASEHYRKIQKAAFIHHDLMATKPLPIEDNIAELVYSSHTIEHVNDEAVRRILAEAYRILKPGGGIRLTTPDAWLELQAYKRGDIKFWYWVDTYSPDGTWEHLYKRPLREASIHQLFLHHFASQLCEIDIDDSAPRKFSDSEIQEVFKRYPDLQALDYFTSQCQYNPDYPGNHINWWTCEKLISFLREAGFSEPYKSGWGQSVFPPLRDTNLFDSTHPRLSLYVEAVKLP